MGLSQVFKTVKDVEHYVTEHVSQDFLGGMPAKFFANDDEQYGSIGSRAILDRASALNVNPDNLLPGILERLNDSRFSAERGFLNFSDESDTGWMLSTEEYKIPSKLSVYILKENQTPFSLMRLQCMATLQNILRGNSVSIVDSIISADEVESLIDKQNNDEVIVLWSAPKGIPTKLFEKLLRTPARAQGRVTFQVLGKPFAATKIVEWPGDYLQRVSSSKLSMLAAAYYYSLPLQASDLDPETCFLQENANIYDFGRRLVNRVGQIAAHYTPGTKPNFTLVEFQAAHTSKLALMLKLLPLRLEAGMCRGELFAFTEGVKRLLTVTEQIINKPDFRASIAKGGLSQVDQFIVNNLMNQLNLLFNYESKT